MSASQLASDEQKGVSEKSRFNKKQSKVDKVNLRNRNARSRKKNKQSVFKKARAAIYIGHIPHGFYEDEMNAYFNQFGKVHSAVVVRSKKTGRSRGYGFVEFKDEEVAKIAAESMNNYLLFNKVLKCRYIAPEERNKLAVFRTVNSVLPKVRNRNLDSANKKKAFQELDQSLYQKKTQKKMDNFKKFFEERGINFSFKVNFKNPGEIKTDESNKVESLPSCGTESEDPSNDQFGVLEIDESDNEIHFKTPPQVKKVIKRSSTCTAPQKEKKRKPSKNSSAPEIKKTKTSEKKKISNCIGKKLEKTTKIRDKPLLKSFKSMKAKNEKIKLTKKNNAATVGRKKGKAKGKKSMEVKQGK